MNYKLLESLQKLERALSLTHDAALEFEHLANHLGYDQPAGECGAYLVGNLDAFLSDRRQNGSVPSLKNAIEEWEKHTDMTDDEVDQLDG